MPEIAQNERNRTMLDVKAEVLGLDCTESLVRAVRLSAGEPLQLLEQLTWNGFEEFQDYWTRTGRDCFYTLFVAEDYPNDPAGVLPFVEKTFPVDRYYVNARNFAYALPFKELGILTTHRRAGALALNKAYQLRASALSQHLMERLTNLRHNLALAEEEAARLYLALSSSIYNLANNF